MGTGTILFKSEKPGNLRDMLEGTDEIAKQAPTEDRVAGERWEPIGESRVNL